MRAFTKEYRLQADSLGDIVQPWEEAALRLTRVLRAEHGKFRSGRLLNAIILDFVALDEREQERVASRALARLRSLLSDDEASGKTTQMSGGTVDDEAAAPVKRRRAR